MTESKKRELQNLVQEIQKVDDMIKLHKSNPSKFMLEQYEAKKEKMLVYFIDELASAKPTSPYSFKLILLAIEKFYPDIDRKTQDEDADLKDLEAVLA